LIYIFNYYIIIKSEVTTKMCGIVGVFGKKADKSNLEEMLKIAERRGPEAIQTRTVENGILGHTLLSFVNEGNNPQPYVDNGATMVYNGEVYNWQELNLKYGLNADTDTATLLRGFRAHGAAFLREVDGQFAFIAQIPRNGKVETVFARDEYGISPLCFGNDREGRVVLGSTEATLAAGGVDPTRIRSVPAGAQGRVEGSNVDVSYWTQLPVIDPKDQKDADIERLRQEAIASIERRIPTTQEKLYTAMGGMDSQFITATIARKTKGKFGGAITIVPWSRKDPTNKTLGDYSSARATVNMLRKEGINLQHRVVQMTPEYVDGSIDRVMDVLGPDYFNVSCGLAEDLVANTAKSLGGKAVMTAGGPDEAGRSYKPINLEHRDRLEEGWNGICDQFASSEGVRAGLVFGEHGLENRVPLAFLIRASQYIKPEQKLVVDSYGDRTNPATMKQREKIFFREMVKPYLPEETMNVPKDTVHGATGTKPVLEYLAETSAEFQGEKDRFYRQMNELGWKGYCIPSGDKSPFGDGPAYCLWRWAKTHKKEFETGPNARYGGEQGEYVYSPELEDKIARPLCYDHMFAAKGGN